MGGSPSQPPPPKFDEPWRKVDWSERGKEELLTKLMHMKPNHPEVSFIRILLHGPVGAGKSSFITSLDNVFKERVTAAAPAGQDDYSYSLNYKTYFLRTKKDEQMAIAINDVMGMEKGEMGIQPEDVINAVNGRLPENYSFNPEASLEPGMNGYNNTPTLQDRPHCLVSVVSADSISRIDPEVLNEMKKARRAAEKHGIPHVALLTMPDLACPLVSKDLMEIYKSKQIKAKMEQCSQLLGITMNCVLPVQNYHEENEGNDKVDVLLMMALTQIVNFANDYLWRIQHQPLES